MEQKLPILLFLNFNVTKVVFDRDMSFNEGEFDINVQHLSKVDEKDKNKFIAEFIITITSKDSLVNFQVQANGAFEIQGETVEAVYNNFLNLSAPTIVYPYIRAFISNVLLQTGMKPLIIPTVNFAALISKSKPELPGSNIKVSG
jgi:preprotein translocase subunit SecB